MLLASTPYARALLGLDECATSAATASRNSHIIQTPLASPARDATKGVVASRIQAFEDGSVFRRPAAKPTPSPMRGTADGRIGADKHSPGHYPLPGQWMSPHHRVRSKDKEDALGREYVGLNVAVHGDHLDTCRGTGAYLQIANWIGSLRENAHYREHLEGAPPGVAEAHPGVRMVQPPMRYTSNPKGVDALGRNGTPGRDARADQDNLLSSTQSSNMISRIVEAQMDSIMQDTLSSSQGGGSPTGSDANNVNNNNNLHDSGSATDPRAPPSISRVGISYGDVAQKRIFKAANLDEETKAKMKARAARRRRAQIAIVDCGGKIGIDHHEPSLYPLPGQTVSKYHRGRGRDKARALARPYVGMNMNVMRRHIAIGHGDGRAASNWIGSLRSRPCGADGAYGKSGVGLQLLKEREDEARRNAAFQATTSSLRDGVSATTSGSGDDETKLMVRTEERRLMSSSAPSPASGKSKYQGNKTQAQMDGVPVGMRWTKPTDAEKTKGYLRLKKKLYRGTFREVSQKWRLREDTPDTGTRMSTNEDLAGREEKISRRSRRQAYGDAAAKRFARKKKRGGWFDSPVRF